VSYSLAKAHKGDIVFESRDEEGTVFEVRLPVSAGRRTYQILVADDDDTVRGVVVQALGRNPAYQVKEASDGVSACIKLGSLRPDLLILDIFMPEMNGLEVCRVIRSDPALASLKVIISTGYPEHQIIEEVSRLGFRNILFKPYKIRDLLETAEAVLEGREALAP
jgi:CheY-like chemotaxis protein